MDEETVLTPEGKKEQIAEGDVLKIQYGDKAEEYSLKELAEERAGRSWRPLRMWK